METSAKIVFVEFLVFTLFCFKPVTVFCRSDTDDQLMNPNFDSRIVGGVRVDIKEVPYQLSFQYLGGHFCGASIIGTKWALTAAHCSRLMRTKNVEKLQMRAGSSRTDSGGFTSPVEAVYTHQKFNIKTIDYDVSVVLVTRAFVEGPTVQTIPLAPTNYNVVAGETLTVSGWGKTREHAFAASPVLQILSVTAISRSTCRNKFGGQRGTISARMFCAGTRRKDTCQGDSGGPLRSHSGYQVGIVSWGLGCARDGSPGVYTNIPNPEIRSFITRITGM